LHNTFVGFLALETFTALRDLVDNPSYEEQRRKSLRNLDFATIDKPIVAIIKGLAELPHCFTLQSCYGHFLYDSQKDPENIQPLPTSNRLTNVDYRIAYLAMCLQDSDAGQRLLHDLEKIPKIDPENVQFGCAEWFWKKQVNSFALQVEPRRYMTRDTATVGYKEALHIEKVRNQFFRQLGDLLSVRHEIST
jgi:hypothetical protein